MKAAFLACSALGLMATTTSLVTLADHPIEEVMVTSTTLQTQITVDAQNSQQVDSAQLLKQLPGANVNSNGPITGIAQYRGMFGNRVNVSVNGLGVTSGGPNAMDAPLSYAPTALLKNLSVHRGVAPVSAAQQSIGGAFVVEINDGDFSERSGWQVGGTIDALADSAASTQNIMTSLNIASQNNKVFIAALEQQADNYEFAGDGSPEAFGEYKRSRVDAAYGFKNDHHAMTLSATRNETGDAATPALPMDIKRIDSDIVRAAYELNQAGFTLQANVSSSDIEHEMTNFHLRNNFPLSSHAHAHRLTLATAESLDGKLMAEFNGPNTSSKMRVGIDYHDASHNADITNPNNAMFRVVNFNEVENTITGIFAEYDTRISDSLNLQSGLRFNQVKMDAADVDSSMAMMMPPVMNFRNAFNSAERENTDNNIDAVVKLTQDITSSFSMEYALAQKTRSASYQERYLWLPMQSSGGLADGRTYVGNLDLEPETAREIGITFAVNHERLMFSPSIFYRDVSDYIQGTSTGPMSPETMLAQMMANTMMAPMMAMTVPDTLQFNNVDAKLYGLDLLWSYTVSDAWRLYGTASVVRGERKDIDDNLYRVSPDNLRVGADFSHQKWLVTAEVAAYAKQSKVSTSNGEQASAGYGLMNISASYNVVKNLRLSVGINNLFDKAYHEHLAGINRARGADVAVGSALPSIGRNAYIKAGYNF